MSSITTVPVINGERSTRSVAIASSEAANSSGDVSEDELQGQLLADPEHRVDVILLHAGADDQDAAVLRRHPHRVLDHPGDPDRLEHHERLAAVDAAPGADRRLLVRIDDLVAAEVLGESAPCGEKSAPTIGPIPSIFIAAMQASPTGPSPITIAASPGAMPDLATAWTPTANGSVIAAISWGSPAGTLIASSSLSAMYSA